MGIVAQVLVSIQAAYGMVSPCLYGSCVRLEGLALNIAFPPQPRLTLSCPFPLLSSPLATLSLRPSLVTLVWRLLPCSTLCRPCIGLFYRWKRSRRDELRIPWFPLSPISFLCIVLESVMIQTYSGSFPLPLCGFSRILLSLFLYCLHKG